MLNLKNFTIFSSSLYSILLAFFFGLVEIANYVNLPNTSTEVSDLAPNLPSEIETIIEPAIERPDQLIVSNFQTAKTVSRALNRSAVSLNGSYIKINGRTIQIYNAKNGLKDDAGSRVAKYNSTFYYGHNSSNVFGSLSTLPDGTTFSIVENNVEKTYRIAHHELFDKAFDGRSDILYLASEGSNRNYANGIYSATFRGKKYDLALMTCAGQSLGGGDATKRYVVFAYEV